MTTILYHGTNQVIREIDLDKSKLRTDFGKSFYLGSNLGIAREWAKSRAGFSGTPIVMRYKFDARAFDDKFLKVCKFESTTVEWLNFVRDNRSRNKSNANTPEPRHSYDIVSGAIANDKVNFVIADYMNELITADEAIRRVKAISSVVQVSFHTPLALSYLEAPPQYQQMHENGKWAVWKSVKILDRLPL